MNDKRCSLTTKDTSAPTCSRGQSGTGNVLADLRGRLFDRRLSRRYHLQSTRISVFDNLEFILSQKQCFDSRHAVVQGELSSRHRSAVEVLDRSKDVVAATRPRPSSRRLPIGPRDEGDSGQDHGEGGEQTIHIEKVPRPVEDDDQQNDYCANEQERRALIQRVHFAHKR